MTTVMASALAALSLTMILFAQCAGYVPVSRPTYRVHRASRPAYFWTLIACYVLVFAMGIFVLIR